MNIGLNKELVKLPYGVYATLTEANGNIYQSLTNIGLHPTVYDGNVTAETYCFGLHDELYGEKIKIEFISFMRPEISFDSIHSLKKQIELDAENRMKIL